MSKRKEYPEELELAVIEYYLMPNSLYNCAKKFGISNKCQVKSILNRHNIPLNTRGPKFTEAFEKQLVDFYLSPNTLNETVRHFNLKNRAELCFVLKKYNIQQHATDVVHKLQLEKIKQTNLERYGTEYAFQVEEVKQKIKATNLEKYNVEYPQQNREIREKGKETLLKNYGRTNVGYFGSPEHDLAIINKYGVKYIAQLDEIKEKRRQTNLEKYGVSCVMNTPEQLEKTRHTRRNDKYIYQDVTFDSFPELCFYLYNKAHGKNVTRATEKLEFLFEDKVHYYFHDFLVDNTLYEIKGRQFLKEDGTWQNPYDHSYDAQAEAKHQCAIKNNVIILYESDYIKYTNWFFENDYDESAFVND